MSEVGTRLRVNEEDGGVMCGTEVSNSRCCPHNDMSQGYMESWRERGSSESERRDDECNLGHAEMQNTEEQASGDVQ